MIKLKEGRKIAVLVNDEPKAIIEDTLRISNINVDYIRRSIRIVFHRGYVSDDKSFNITGEPVIIELNDDNYYSAELNKVVQGNSFTQITTPLVEHTTRWYGDFRKFDIEHYVVSSNLLPVEVEGIVEEK